MFIDYLPGMPDNIRFDGDGQYWIGLPTVNWLLLLPSSFFSSFFQKIWFLCFFLEEKTFHLTNFFNLKKKKKKKTYLTEAHCA